MNCQQIQKLSSDHIDNILSARDTIDVDRHLADCNPCALFYNEMRQTVAAVSDMPKFEVSDDFMAKLQSRIADVEPTPARRSVADAIRSAFRPRVRPVWAAGLAACGLAAFFMAPGSVKVDPITEVARNSEPQMVQEARTHNIALAATDPFGDTAAASLAASRSINGPNTAENP